MRRAENWLVVLILVWVGSVSGYVLESVELETSQLVHGRQKRAAACHGNMGKVSSNGGVIQLPTQEYNGTEFYGPNQDCSWQVSGLPGYQLLFTSEYFSLEMSDDCEFDYLEIYEKNKDRRSKFCSTGPLHYISDDNAVEISFHSDVSYEDMGFKIIVTLVKPDDNSGCNQTVSVAEGQSGSVTNKDTGSRKCFYSIQAPEGSVVELTVDYVNMGSEPCSDEYIVVQNSRSSHGEQMMRICSETPAGLDTLRAQNLFIEYTNTNGNEGDRFKLKYKVVVDNFTPAPTVPTTPSPVGGDNDCSKMIKDTNELEHLMVGPEYQDNKECIVVARATRPGYVVQITFTKFEIEESENCEFDSLRLYNGEREDSGEIGGPYCGETLKGRTFVSRGNSLRYVFKTDESFALYGYKADIKFVPTGCNCEDRGVCVLQDYEKKCLQGKKCNLCQNGGTCVDTGSDTKCYCLEGYSGEYCTIKNGTPGHIRFTNVPQSVPRVKLSKVFVNCEAQSTDPANQDEIPQYFWYFKERPIPPHNAQNKMGTMSGGTILAIDEFSEDEVGEYSCVAKIGEAEAEHTFELDIVEECSRGIQKGPVSKTEKIDTNTLLQCTAPGVASVRWQKDGQDINIDPNNQGARIKMLSQSLLIQALTLDDSGKYKCISTDQKGCESEREATLQVLNVKKHNSYCGKSIHDEQAVGFATKAKDAKPNDNPWHITLQVDVPGERKDPFCGGTLVSKKYIVTAAHCLTIFRDKYHVEMGSNNVWLLFASTNCYDAPLKKRLKRTIMHENFNKTVNFDNDIALIELEEPVEYSQGIRPICLEPEEFIETTFLKTRNPYGKVVGCGQYKLSSTKSAENLQELFLPYVDRTECVEAMEKESRKITGNMICAGWNIRGKGDVCGGDSGGGYMMLDENRWVLTGIVSWGVGSCDRAGYYTAYTNVAKYYDWIEARARTSTEDVDIDTLRRPLQ